MKFFFSKKHHDDLLIEFERKYVDNRDFVRASLYWVSNSSAIDDLVQETFLKAWKSYPLFKGNSSFKTWIYRIARNTAYDYLKKNHLHVEIEEDMISQSADTTENKDLITKGLMTLNLGQREAFSLHYIQEYSYKEIAEFLDIPEGTVKSRVNLGKNQFKAFLKKNGVHDE